MPRAQTEPRATANSTQQCLGPQRGCATEARARSLQGLGSPRWRSPFWQCHVKSCARALGQPSASRHHHVPRALEAVWEDRLGRGDRSRPQLSHRWLVWQLQVRTSATSRRLPSSEQAWLVGINPHGKARRHSRLARAVLVLRPPRLMLCGPLWMWNSSGSVHIMTKPRRALSLLQCTQMPLVLTPTPFLGEELSTRRVSFTHLTFHTI